MSSFVIRGKRNFNDKEDSILLKTPSKFIIRSKIQKYVQANINFHFAITELTNEETSFRSQMDCEIPRLFLQSQ